MKFPYEKTQAMISNINSSLISSTVLHGTNKIENKKIKIKFTIKKYCKKSALAVFLRNSREF